MASEREQEAIWLNKETVAYLEPNSPQTKNDHITLIKTNDPRNKQGYDFLIYSPLGRKKPYPVIFYYGTWHHLGYNRDRDTVYLDGQFPEVSNYDPKEEEPRPDSPESIQETDDLDRTI